MLFDLEHDPEEVENLYNLKDFEDVQRRLEKRLLDELILQNDKQSLVNKRHADQYRVHVMKYDMWKPEFDELNS